MTCAYANLFGAPDTGLHRYRIANIAVVDTAVTVLLALIIAYVTRRPFGWVLLGLFVLGIFIHRLFCVRTTVDKLVFR